MHLCGKGGCGVSPAGGGRWSFSSAQSRCDHTGVLCPVLGSSAQERYGHTGVSAVKATKLFRDWTWFSADSWTPMGILLLSITTIGKDWKGRARLLTEVSRTRMRDNKHCKFWLGVSIFYWFYYLHIFFYHESDQTLEQVPRNNVKSPFSDIFKTWPENHFKLPFNWPSFDR